MDDDVRKAAANAVKEKFLDLMDQRVDAVRQRGEVERVIRGIDRALFDCRAAGRLFGVDIELPEDARPGMIVRPNPARAAEAANSIAARNQAAHRVAHNLFSVPHHASTSSPELRDAAVPSVPTVASTTLVAGAEPSIRDLILLYLKQAGGGGIKAAALRRKVEAFLNRQIHYKTIGMSLYRLSKEEPPLVKRDGLIWTFVPPDTATKNPGVDAPGPIEGR
jgi:hypothetical protein